MFEYPGVGERISQSNIPQIPWKHHTTHSLGAISYSTAKIHLAIVPNMLATNL
jgi:hypothetical protein